MKIWSAYISKTDSNWEKQIIILMIKKKKKNKRLTSRNNGNFDCLNYLHSFITENKLKSQKKVHKNKDFCGTVMSFQKLIYYIDILYYRIFQFNQRTK